MSLFIKYLKFIILITAAISLLTQQVQAVTNIDSLYQKAMEALEVEDWEMADSFSTQALRALDSILVVDWSYTGERMPIAAQFLGEYLFIMTRAKEAEEHDRVEVYDPKTGDLLRIFNLAPYYCVGKWYENRLFRQNNVIYTALSKKGGVSNRLLIFGEDNLFDPLYIDLDGSDFTFVMMKQNMLYFEEKINYQYYLSRVNTLNGGYKKLHPIKSVNDEENFRYLQIDFRLFEIDNTLIFLDGNRVYRLNPYSETVEFLYSLPIETFRYDSFHDPCYFVFRADTLFKFDLHSSSLAMQTIQLPYSVEVADWAEEPRLFSQERRITQIRGDSLFIMSIIGSNAQIDTVYPSFGDELSVKGDYVINSGEQGLRILHGDEHVFSISDSLVKLIISTSDSILYYHKIPGEIVAFDLFNRKILWRETISAFGKDGWVRTYKDKYIWINCGNDSKYLLDALTGDIVSIIHNQSGIPDPAFSPDSTSICIFTTRSSLYSGEFCQVRRLIPYRYIRGDLLGMIAIGSFHKGDTTSAIETGKQALASEKNLSEEINDELYNLLVALNLDKQALRLAARSFLASGGEKWKAVLKKKGLELATEPIIAKLGELYLSEKNIVAWDQYSKEDYAFSNRKLDLYFIPLQGEDIVIRNEPIFAAFRFDTPEGPILYSFSRDSSSNRISWTPLLLHRHEGLKSLRPLPDTYLADDYTPSRYNTIFWWTFSGTEQGEAGYILGNFMRYGMSNDYLYYTVGIDISGEGASWADTTTDDPIKAGRQYFAHRTYGDFITQIVEDSQADSLHLQEGDIVLGLGDYFIGNTYDINTLKEKYEEDELIDLHVLRNDDTLTYKIRNGQIGYFPARCLELVKMDPRTGNHLSTYRIPPGFQFSTRNTDGLLIYQFRDTLYFFDPMQQRGRKVIIRDLSKYTFGYSKTRLERSWTFLETDKIAIHDEDEKFLGLDLSTSAADSERVLWKQVIENVHYCPGTDDPMVQPILLKSGVLCFLEQETGAIINREILPFESISEAFVDNGFLYGFVEGRIVGWRLSYYHPPFPWRYFGYGAAALIPLLIATFPVYRMRINKLKQRQAVELERAELDAEFAAARKLQASLIPAGSHELGKFHLVGKFIPATLVGGDYFDFRLLDDGRLVVLMGDVSGHGLPAGTLVAMAKASLITVHRSKVIDIKDTLDALNEVMRKVYPGQLMFMTFCFLVIEPEKGIVGCSANGHPFPLIARKDGSILEIAKIGGYPLGVRDQQDFRIIEANFVPGDTLLIYTDGLPEQVNETGEPWGYDKFQDTFEKLAKSENAETVADGLLSEVLQYADDAVQADDMTVVVVRYR